MACNFTPSICHINLGAIVRNFARLGPAPALMPVIKSDAYGHGLLPVAEALAKAGARRFAVGGASEGHALREAGLNLPVVLLMGCLDSSDWALAINDRLIPLAGSFEDIKACEAALAPGQQVEIAIKCDTGMSRLGFRLEELGALLEELDKRPGIRPLMLISHLASADMPEDDAYTRTQLKTFEEFYAGLRVKYPGILRSIGNSAGTLGHEAALLDVARPGLALYGGNPFAGSAKAALGEGLEWAMSLCAPVLQTRELAPGQSVSYGRIFKAPKAMRIAIVASGYATGVPRNLSGRFAVLANGHRAPQIGRICMSMFMVDISQQPEIRKGDKVWLLGGEAAAGERAPDAQELAEALNTIPYELLCGLGSLNPRSYHS